MRGFLSALFGRGSDDKTDDSEEPLAARQQPPAICRNRADLELAMGTVCTVVGTYAVHPFTNQKGVQFREWPVAVLDDETAVLIESLWDEGAKHSDDIIEKFDGKRVTVKGMLHAQPPGSFTNIGVPCISPVESIE